MPSKPLPEDQISVLARDYDFSIDSLFGEFAIVMIEHESEIVDTLLACCKAAPIFMLDSRLGSKHKVWAAYVDIARHPWEIVYRNPYWQERVEKDYFHSYPTPQNKEEPKPSNNSSEPEFEILSRTIAKLENGGWQVASPFTLEHGEADAMAHKQNHKPMLIEAKGTASINTIAHALGQLLVYQQQFDEEISLALALPTEPDDFLRRVLDKYQVTLLIP